MPDSRPAVAILCVARIEPHVQGEWLVFGLRLNELDAAINNHLRLVTQAAIRLFFVERISANCFEFIKVIFTFELAWHLGVPFPKVAGAVPVLTQQIAVEGFDCCWRCGVRIARGSKAAASQPTEDCRATDPTDRMTDTGVIEPRAFSGQGIDVGGLNNGISIATQCAGGLVIRKEKYDVWLFRRLCLDAKRLSTAQQ